MFHLQQYSGQGGTVSADGNSRTIEKLTLEEGSVLACQWQRIVVDENSGEIHLSYGENFYFSGLIKIQNFSLYIIYFFKSWAFTKKTIQKNWGTTYDYVSKQYQLNGNKHIHWWDNLSHHPYFSCNFQWKMIDKQRNFVHKLLSRIWCIILCDR